MSALSSTDPEPEELDVALEHGLRLSHELPRTRRRDIIVEAGRVEQEVSSEAGELLSRRRLSYLLLACRGVVLALGEDLAPALRPISLETVEASSVDGDVPVIFGPSAALALTIHCLEVTNDDPDRARAPVDPCLSVIESADSPYPPHCSPLVGLCGWDSCRPLISAGAFHAPSAPRSQSALAGVFLVRPESWSRPLAALANDELGTLSITAASAPRALERALLLEASTPLSAGAGDIAWEAEFSLLDARSGALAGAAPLRLHLDARRALASVRGALGEPRAALARDAILGERYGFAPMLITNLRARDLMECHR